MPDNDDLGSDLAPDAACYYDRVGIDPRADEVASKVEKTYHAANDRRRDDEMSPKEFNRIKEARDLLRDEEERKQYNIFVERYGRDAGTEAYHTWDDQGRPSSPDEWTPPSQSSDVGPERGRTPETGEEENADESTTTTNRQNRTDTDAQRTPDDDRRRRRQQSETRNRDQPETTRDSGARTREQTTQQERTQQRDQNQTQQRTQTRQQQSQPQPSVDSTAEAVEAATAMKYRAGYVLCTFGITATLGLTIAYILNLVQYQNEIGSVGFAFSITVLSAVFVTRRWTSAIEATSAAETVYENVIIRPRQIKYVGIAGLLLTIIQYVVEGAIPSIVYTLIGLLVFIGVFLAPMIYILTQTYDVSFKALWRKTQQG